MTTDIRIKGFGYDPANPFFTNDIENGQLVEPIAATNRKVVIIALNSEQATTFELTANYKGGASASPGKEHT